eukprot:3209119-Amphidinium_carterae.1
MPHLADVTQAWERHHKQGHLTKLPSCSAALQLLAVPDRYRLLRSQVCQSKLRPCVRQPCLSWLP